MAKSAAFLHRCHYLETTPSQDFFQCSHHAASLIHNDVERPHRAARRNDNSLLSLMKRHRHSHAVFAHHAIHNAVEKQFQCAGDIAPIARRAYNNRVASLYLLQHSLRIVVGHHTFLGRAAFHTRYARANSQLRHLYHIHISPTTRGLVLYHFEHPRNVAVLPRTCIENQNIHIIIN